MPKPLPISEFVLVDIFLFFLSTDPATAECQRGQCILLRVCKRGDALEILSVICSTILFEHDACLDAARFERYVARAKEARLDVCIKKLLNSGHFGEIGNRTIKPN